MDPLPVSFALRICLALVYEMILRCDDDYDDGDDDDDDGDDDEDGDDDDDD